MPHHEQDTRGIPFVQMLLDQGLDGLPDAIAALINYAMVLEREKALHAAPYERTEQRCGHANGFKDKTLQLRMGKIPLKIPQVRGDVSFYPSVFERGQRSERAFAVGIAEAYFAGVSTRKMKDLFGALCGFEVSAAQVSEAAATLDEHLKAWRTRSLGCIKALILDATYEKVRIDHAVCSCAVLVASGVMEDGRRCILGTSTALGEAEVHWRTFLESLVGRGMHGVRYIVSDAHSGLKAALRTVFPGVAWQRCQTHLQRDAQHYITKSDLKAVVASDIRAIFNAPSEEEARRLLKIAVEKYSTIQSKLSAWMEDNIPEGFAVFALPEQMRKKLRTSNMAENLNTQLKRRTRVALLFPNENALLRMVSALLSEISEEWESNKIYLNMEGMLS